MPALVGRARLGLQCRLAHRARWARETTDATAMTAVMQSEGECTCAGLRTFTSKQDRGDFFRRGRRGVGSVPAGPGPQAVTRRRGIY
jgi:hypothetical protein